MTWLQQVLAEHATLDLNHPDGRARMAEAILEAAPRLAIADAIKDSTRAVLAEKGIPDERNMLAREIGNNAAQTTMFALEGCE